MLKKIKGCFYTGVITLLPVILTLYIFGWIANFLLVFIKNTFLTKFIRELIIQFVHTTDLEFYITGIIYFLSFVAIFLFICLVGGMMRHVLVAKIAKALEKFVTMVPIVKHIYSTISQIVSLISSEKNKTYQKVVLLEYPRKGIYSLGFMTSEQNHSIESVLNEETMCNIFIPTSPNPTSGMFVVIPKRDIKILDIKIEDAIKLIISGGVITPEKKGG